MKVISITLTLVLTLGLAAFGGVRLILEPGSTSGELQTESVAFGSLAGEAALLVAGGSSLQTPALTASFLFSSNRVQTLEEIWLDASGSEGAIAAYQWDLDGDGIFELGSTSVSQVASYPENGSYAIQLRVEDAAGNAALSSILTIEVENRAPIAEFALGSQPSDLTELVLLDASSDADGEIVSWAWDFGDGAISDVSDPVHQYAAAGTYVVTLVVTDDEGVSSEPATQTVQVGNTAPVAGFTLQGGVLQTGEVLTFLDESADPSADGKIVHVGWDFGDGSYYVGGLRSDRQYTHVYSEAGSYTVILYVIDDSGALSQAQMTLTILDS